MDLEDGKLRVQAINGSRTACLMGIAMLFALPLCLLAQAAASHEQRPAIADIVIKTDAIELAFSLQAVGFMFGQNGDHHGAPSHQTDSEPRTPATLKEAEWRDEAARAMARLRSMLAISVDGAPVVLEPMGVDLSQATDSDDRIATFRLRGSLQSEARRLEWMSDASIGDVALRVKRAGADRPFYGELIAAGSKGASIVALADGQVETAVPFIDYAKLGFTHILPKGLDHILFIVGLFLLSPRMRPLLILATTFTVAHSITLALGILDIVRIPAEIVEPLIAASIVFVALENAFPDRLRQWRPLVVFGFGLLHGLGFAGVLEELGLPTDQFFVALLGFNVGVELGQITVLALCFLAVGLWFQRRAWYRRAVTIPASALIAAIGGFWFFERVGLLAV